MTPTTLDALIRLQAALDQLACALATGRADAVLSAEEPLAAAVSGLSTLDRRTIGTPGQLRDTVRAARLALGRCRVLGQTAADFGRAALPLSAYTRSGLQPADGPHSSHESTT